MSVIALVCLVWLIHIVAEMEKCLSCLGLLYDGISTSDYIASDSRMTDK
jgi:hypothetical protein